MVCVPNVREGNAAELQISGLVLAARVVEWKLHIPSAPSSSTSFCADFAVADGCRGPLATHLEAKRVFILTGKQSVTRARRGRLLYFGIGKDGQDFIEQLLQWISTYSVMKSITPVAPLTYFVSFYLDLLFVIPFRVCRSYPCKACLALALKFDGDGLQCRI
jgi:hypothetical protein